MDGAVVRAWAFAALLSAAVTGTACGGRVSGPGGDGDAGASTVSHGSAEESDGGAGATAPFDAADFPACPAEPPIVGSACVSADTGCAYFTNASCAAFVCDASGHWQSSTQGC